MLKNQKGQSLIEYLLIVAIVAIGSLGIMRTVGHSVNVKFANVAKALGANVQGNIEAATVTESSYKKKDLRNFMSGSLNKESNPDE